MLSVRSGIVEHVFCVMLYGNVSCKTINVLNMDPTNAWTLVELYIPLVVPFRVVVPLFGSAWTAFERLIDPFLPNSRRHGLHGKLIEPSFTCTDASTSSPARLYARSRVGFT